MRYIIVYAAYSNNRIKKTENFKISIKLNRFLFNMEEIRKKKNYHQNE